MSESSFWLILCGLALGIEVLTGTFYLLLIAIAFGAASVAAHLGLPAAFQLVLAAGVGLSAVTALWLWRRTSLKENGADSTAGLDSGEIVEVTAWQPDRTAQVRYRGAVWSAVADNVDQPRPGRHKIVGIQANRLVLSPVDAASRATDEGSVR